MDIFHLFIDDLWHKDLLTKPIAIVQVYQKTCFGPLEHLCVDTAIAQGHTSMAPMTLWSHSQIPEVIQGTAGRTGFQEAAPKHDAKLATCRESARR